MIFPYSKCPRPLHPADVLFRNRAIVWSEERLFISIVSHPSGLYGTLWRHLDFPLHSKIVGKPL